MRVQVIISTADEPRPHSKDFVGVRRVVWTNVYADERSPVGVEIHTRAAVHRLRPSSIVQMEILP